MKYYEWNLECLKKHRQNLYQAILNWKGDSETNQIDKVYTLTAKNKELSLVVQKNSKEYRLNSSYHPSHEAEKWAEQFSFNSINLIITMFGLGSGIFAEEIMKRRGHNDILFIYEPSMDIFVYVLHHYDISTILKDPKIVLIIEGVNEFEFHTSLQKTVNITNITSQIRCTHPYYDLMFQESCISYWKEIKDNYYHAKININTEIVFGERFIKNSLFNTRYLCKSSTIFEFEKYLDKDIPAIIVAAGPSLKDNIEDLKRAKGKAYIFVVDRSLDYVLNEGLEPDFIVTIDPVKPIEYFTKREDISIPLLCDMVSNWEVLNHHKGKKIFLCCNQYYKNMYDYIGKKAEIFSLGVSVATAGFSTCVKLGFKRIILVGQDLAYDGEQTHAGGVEEKFDNMNDVFVEGVDGKQVRSRQDWYEFITWYKDMLTIYSGIDVIDAKDKGAKIQGTTVMDLKSAVNKYCNREINNLDYIRTKESYFNDLELKKLNEFFMMSLDEIAILKKKSKEAINLCDSQIREYKKSVEDNQVINKNFKRLSKINQYISEQPVYNLLEFYITAATVQQISSIYQYTDDINIDKINTYEKSKHIYCAIVDAINFVEPLLEDAINQMLN